MNFNRYDLATLWVKTIKRVWTSSFVATSFRRTGVKPFCRSAHLVGNAADVEIADTIASSDEMQRQAYQRRLRQQERETIAASSTSDTTMPIRVSEVVAIAQVFGSADTTQLSPAFKSVVDTHKLSEWPRSATSRTKPQAWNMSLRSSPALISKLRRIDVGVLRKWFDVGAVVNGFDTLTPEQVYMCTCMCCVCP